MNKKKKYLIIGLVLSLGIVTIGFIIPQIIIDWLIAIGTLSLALVAIFQDKIRSLFIRPNLKLLIDIVPPDCHKTICWQRIACYFFRFRIKNYGDQRAELVEVFASELKRKQADGTYKKVDSFIPMNLLWSNIGKPFFSAISPGMEKFCDLGHIINPKDRNSIDEENDPSVPTDKTIFSCALEIKPYSKNHHIHPGEYQLILIIGAANSEPISETLEINITGNWYDDERDMFSKGVGIKKI